MPQQPWGTRRRAAMIVVMAGGTVLVGITAAQWWLLDDDSRAIPVEEVVENFRESSEPDAPVVDTTGEVSITTTTPDVVDSTIGETDPTTPTSAGPIEPLELVEPGVYRYATNGSEEIDVLGGTTHVYPDHTTVTVTMEGCGVRLRWDALRERREEWRLCASPDGIALQTDAVQYHEFFGQGETEDVVCDVPVVVVPVVVVPVVDEPVARVQRACMLADDPWAPVWEVLEPSTMEVNGEIVAVRHVRMTVDDTDDYWEDATIEWYLAPNGLPVVVSVISASKSPSLVGDVVYHERYELELLSLVPLR